MVRSGCAERNNVTTKGYKPESKCSIKIETNSKGYNTTVHVHGGVTSQEIDDTVEKAYMHILMFRIKLKIKSHTGKNVCNG